MNTPLAGAILCPARYSGIGAGAETVAQKLARVYGKEGILPTMEDVFALTCVMTQCSAQWKRTKRSRKQCSGNVL